MLAQPDFTTLIVTYQSAGEIAHLLDDLRRLAPGQRVVVVDNASADGTVELIRSRYPEVALVPNPDNVGYGKAVNQGMASCPSEFVFLLNPDVRLHDPGFHHAMLAALAADPRVAAVGPLQVQLVRGREHLNHTWSFWSPRTLAFFLARSLGLDNGSSAPMPTMFLNAGCLLLRRSAFEEVGRFDERHFLYGEEPDLFLKLRRFGYRALLLPATRVVHHRERSIGHLPLRQRWKRRLGGAVNVSGALVTGVVLLTLWRWHRRRVRSRRDRAGTSGTVTDRSQRATVTRRGGHPSRGVSRRGTGVLRRADAGPLPWW